jgi:hypothetical protein
MKQILIQCRLDGTISWNIQNLNFQSENLATSIKVDYPTEYASYTKRIDIFVGKNKTTDFKLLGTSNPVSFNLEEGHLKSGYISIQPIAISGDTKVKFGILKLDVHKSLDVIESDTTVTVSVAQTLQDEIDDLELTKAEITYVDSQDTLLQNQITNNTDDINTLESNRMFLDGSNSNVDVLTFNPTTLDLLSSVGQVRFNSQLKTLEVKISDSVTIQVGKELVIEATNKETSTIANGKACYISGGAGANAWCKFATVSDANIAQ